MASPTTTAWVAVKASLVAASARACSRAATPSSLTSGRADAASGLFDRARTLEDAHRELGVVGADRKRQSFFENGVDALTVRRTERARGELLCAAIRKLGGEREIDAGGSRIAAPVRHRAR